MKKIYGVKQATFSEPFLFFESIEDALEVAMELRSLNHSELVCECLFFEASQRNAAGREA